MIIFSLDGEHDQASKLVTELQQELGEDQVQFGQMEQRHFPDGETYLRIDTDVKQQELVVLCQLHQPNEKLIDLMLFAETAKHLGAYRIHLVAPYLAYMRQDKQFNQGECISSRYVAKWLSEYFDSLITIDPHLHRYKTLDEIYSMPAESLHATDLIAHYIRDNIRNPLVIGPDSESEQWADAVAKLAGCDAIVLSKQRFGDHEVKVSLPQLEQYPNHQPVLIDDIISTGRTMIMAAENIINQGGQAPICIAVHGVFSPGSFDEMQRSNIRQIVTCDTISHSSNKIQVVTKLAKAILAMKKTMDQKNQPKFDFTIKLKGEL
jgi:ribose-phosphate pyrophosphokinase